MKCPWAALLLAAFCCAAAHAAPAKRGKPVDVYLLAGQSNATGQGYVTNLPPGFVANPGVLLFASGLPHHDTGAAALTWLPLHPVSESPDRFGPELGLGNRLQQLFPAQHIALIKHSHVATNLFSDWNPGSDENDRAHWGPQFRVFVDTVRAGMQGLRDMGYAPTLRGMFWQQGENDSSGAAAEQYGAHLAHFVARVRQQFHAPGLVFVYGYVLPPPNSGPGRDLVRAGERDVDQNSGSPLAVRGAFVVPTDDLEQRAGDPHSPYPQDHLHFGTAGLLELGRRMADKMAQSRSVKP